MIHNIKIDGIQVDARGINVATLMGVQPRVVIDINWMKYKGSRLKKGMNVVLEAMDYQMNPLKYEVQVVRVFYHPVHEDVYSKVHLGGREV